MGKRLVLVATYKNGETIEMVRHSFDTPATSQGLEIEDGVIVGIGDCPDTVLYINQPIAAEAFKAAGIKEVYLGAGVTSIGNDAFFGCSALTEIVIPDSVTLLDTEAFQGCEEIRNITLPKMSPHLSSATYDPSFSVTDVYYGGTKADWREQYQNSYFPITVTGVVHCSDGDITH